MADKKVGGVLIEIVADFSKFRTSLDAGIRQAVSTSTRAAVEVTADTTKAKAEVAELDRAIRGVNSAVDVQADTATALASVGDLQASIAGINPALDIQADTTAATASVGDLSGVLAGIDTSLDVTADASQARAELNSIAVTELVKFEGSGDFTAVRSAIDGLLGPWEVRFEAVGGFDSIRSQLGEISRPIEIPVSTSTLDGGSSSSSAADSGGGGGSGAAGLALGLGKKSAVAAGGLLSVGAISEIASKTGDLDAATAELAVRLNLTAETSEKFRNQFLDLGADVDLGKQSMLDAAEAAVTLSAKGITNADSVRDILRPTLQLSIIAKEGAAEAAEQIATISNVLKVPAKDIESVVEQLGSAAKQGADVRLLASSIGEAGGAYKLLFRDQAPLDQTKNLATAFTILAKSGLSGSEAGGSLKRALLELVNPSKQQVDTMLSLSKAAERAGIDVGKSANAFTKVDGTMRSQAEAQALVDKAFKNGAISSATYGQLQDRLFKAGVDYNKATKEQSSLLWDAAVQAKKGGELYEANADIFHNLDGSIRPINEQFALLNKVQESGIVPSQEFGKSMSVVFGSFGLQAATRLTDAAGSFDAVNKAVGETGNVAKLSAAQAAGYRGALDAVGGSAETVAVQLGDLARPLLEGGIRKGADALSGLSGILRNELPSAATEASKKFSEFINSTNGKKLVEGFTETADKLGKLFSKLWDDVKQVFDAGITIITVLWNTFGGTLVTFITDTVQGIMKVVGGFMDIISGTFQLIADILTGKWGEVWDDIKQILGGAVDVLLGMFDQWFSKIKLIWGLLGDLLGDGMKKAWELALKALKAGADLALDAMKKAPGVIAGGLADLGKFLAEKAADGVKALVKFLTDAVPDLVKTAADWAVKIPGGLVKLGSGLVDKAGDAIADMAKELVKGGTTLATEAGKWVTKIPGALGGLGKAIAGEIGDALVDGAKAMASLGLELGKALGKAIVDAIKSLGSVIAKAVRDVIPSPKDVLGVAKDVLGSVFPGSANGEIIRSHTVRQVGEDGIEVVLPLTRPKRMQELLASPDVLPAVERALAGLGRGSSGAGNQFNFHMPPSLDPQQLFDAFQDRIEAAGGNRLSPAIS